MNENKLEIAVYGKGGIGKSTICANLSAALAEKGERVLQIGCDPKHDSTRQLMGGRMLPTVLEYLRDTPAELAKIDAVLGTGYKGVGCIEAGGPRPGIGCAGRGIISAFEYLEKNKVKEDYDIVTYDVLGDVVCGGFAVPIRREYADAVFLVTSGEFMALYAANNILRGIRNFDSDKHRRVAGIIFNRRMVADEVERVERFAKAVRLPICAVVPRSDLFAKAEEAKITVMEMGTKGEEREVFLSLAERIKRGLDLYEARPLEDSELEAVVLQGEDLSSRMESYEEDLSGCSGCDEESCKDEALESMAGGDEKKAALLKDKLKAPEDKAPARAPLYGCAFNGACTTAIHLTDAVIIAHSPKSCAFYTWQNISSPGRRNMFNRGILMPSAISPNFESTQMDDHDAVFGGIDKLRASVARALEKKPGAVVVISACVSGIIGDDVLSVEDMSMEETPVIVIPADGDISGDYMHGIEMTLHKLAEKLVEKNAAKIEKSVNIIGEIGVNNNTAINYETIKRLLGELGISINCRFLGDATAAEVRKLAAAPLNILALETPDNLKLKDWLSEKYGCRFFGQYLPIGYRATEKFLRDIAAYFGCEEKVDRVIAGAKEEYLQQIERLRPLLKGKKVILTTINSNIDWLLDTAEEAGIDFAWIGILNYLKQELIVSEDPKRMERIHEIFSRDAIRGAITEYRPDIVISGFYDNLPEGDYVTDSFPMTQKVGFESGIEVLDRWALLLGSRREGAWTDDRKFFEKYFA